MARGYMKRNSIASVITEMQVKTTLTYYCIPTRLAKGLTVLSMVEGVEQ